MPILLAFTLTFFTMTCLAASRVPVVLFALQLGATPLTVGLLGAGFAVFPMLLAWHAGKFIDRLGARGPLTFACCIGGIALTLPYFVPTLTALFIASVLMGVASTFYNLSLQSVVGRLSTAESRTRNFNNYSMVIAATNGLGPLLAGLMIDRYGHAITFIADASLLIVPLVLLVTRGGMLPTARADAAAAHGVRQMLTNPRVRPVFIASTIAQCGLEVFHVYIPVYTTKEGLSASATGVVIAMGAVGSFCGRLALTRLIAWRGEEKVLAYALMLAALAFVAVPFFKSALALSIIAFVFGAGINCSQPITLMLLYSRSPKGRSGEAFGLRFALDNGSRLVGPVVFGFVASVFGLGAIFWLDAVIIAAGSMAMTKAGRKQQD